MTTLFLKYRPQVFADIVGQEAVVRTLQNALKSSRPAHAYLFAGSRGTGKTSTARIFAKGLNCAEASAGEPCGKCEICRTTADGSLVDVIEIDAASNRGIDEIRDLREKVNFMPNIASRKIYIIDEVHMLTKEAFNALLKTLEEPPEHAFFLLATTELHKIPETIISRCQTFTFGRFTIEQLVERLEQIAKTEKISADTEALSLIAKKAEGGLRDAIGLLEQIAAETENSITSESVRKSLGISSSEQLENFWNALEENQTAEALTILKSVAHAGGDFRTFGHDFLGFLREQMHALLQEGASLGTLLDTIEEIETALARCKTSPIVELPFEIAVIRLTQGAPVQTGRKNPETKPTEKPATKAVSPPEPAPDAAKSETPKAAPAAKAADPEPPVSVEKKATPREETSGFLFDDAPSPSNPIEEKVPVSTPPPEKPKEQPPTPVEHQTELSVAAVREKMPLLAEKAALPSSVKKSFLSSCTPELAGDKILFRSNSNFHLNQLNTAEIKHKLIGVTELIFGKKWMVDFAHSSTVTPAEEKKDGEATADDFLKF
ncbi:MAG: DNA polymerase III subunit gamma/tau [Candidatus Gracilibacteria bacterium]|nr:DNA polymerase III subunit gamma/tau [Candidatus Gracilibacteria bacterium]